MFGGGIHPAAGLPGNSRELKEHEPVAKGSGFKPGKD